MLGGNRLALENAPALLCHENWRAIGLPQIAPAGHVAVGHHPHARYLVGWVVPEDIAGPIAVEIAGAGNLPASSTRPAEIIPGGYFPTGHCPIADGLISLIVQENIARAVAVEIAGAGNLPASSTGLAEIIPGRYLATGHCPVPDGL